MNMDVLMSRRSWMTESDHRCLQTLYCTSWTSIYTTHHCGHTFARYADDFVICVKSKRSAERVKEHVTRFLEHKLKLHINVNKSRICTSNELEFLGFCFRKTKIVWRDKALQQFKHRVRQLTGRSWGVSLAYRYHELRLYVVGWLNYFALSEYYRPIPELDEWLRRRMRCVYWKMWRWPRTKIKHLISLGVSERQAIKTRCSSKGRRRKQRKQTVLLSPG